MTKNKDKSKAKRTSKSSKKDIAREIKRAEKRLSNALTDVDAAREKVSRRERELAKLMKHHGMTMAPTIVESEAIPLAASTRIVSEIVASDTESEVVKVELFEEPAAGSGEHHE